MAYLRNCRKAVMKSVKPRLHEMEEENRLLGWPENILRSVEKADLQHALKDSHLMADGLRRHEQFTGSIA